MSLSTKTLKLTRICILLRFCGLNNVYTSLTNDTDVKFEFSKDMYTVSEGAGVQDNLINVNKIGITELNYNVELTVQQPQKVASNNINFIAANNLMCTA